MAILHYSDHAANERTFLAWVRTGIAIVAFGFVVERFNLFLAAIAAAGRVEAPRHITGGPIGRYEGLALILVGLALIILSAVRFIRTGRRIDDEETHAVGSVRTELVLAAVLAFLIAGYTIYIALS
jgi:putative membrane protein